MPTRMTDFGDRMVDYALDAAGNATLETGAVPEPMIQIAKEKVKEATKQATNTEAKGGRRRNKSNGRGAPPGQPPGRSPEIGRAEADNPNSAFGNIPIGPNTGFNSARDESPYAVPFAKQELSSDSNTTRTWLNMIEITMDSILQMGTNTIIDQALNRIYATYKKEVLINTNGGTASSKAEFTFDKLRNYLKAAMAGVALCREVKIVRAWDPVIIESNQQLRKMKDAASSSTALMIAMNRLDNNLAVLCLPPRVLEYYDWIFQTYKKSPVQAGVHQRFISENLAKDFNVQDSDFSFEYTVAAMNAVSQNIEDNIDSYSIIAALFEQKAGVNTVNLRNRSASPKDPCYDDRWNAMVNNGYSFYPNSTDTGTIRTKGLPSINDSLKVACPMDRNNVPVHVTSYFLTNWEAVRTGTNSGFPFFDIGFVSPSDPGGAGIGNSNQFIVEDTNTGYGFNIRAISEPFEQISDYNYIMNNTSSSDGIYRPSGLNVTLYEPTYQSVTDACQLLMLDVFGVI